MPNRAEILETLAASEAQVVTFFQELSPRDLERPATANEVPGAAPWRAKDHLAHLAQNERNIEQLLSRVLAGDTRDVLLRRQYPPGMPLPGILGDLDALTPEELERLVLAIADINQTYLIAHQDDTLEQLVADFRAARLELLNLLDRFTDEQLAASVPGVVGEAAAGDYFLGRAAHAADHISSIEVGLRQSS